MISAVVRLLVQLAQQTRQDPQPPRWLPPALPQPRPPRPLRPTVHHVLATTQDDEFILLTGRVQPRAESLIAPLSGTACVAYVAVAQPRHEAGASPPATHVQEMQIAPLVVTVQDGEVVIEASEGECVVKLRTSEISPRAPEQETAFLAKRQLQHYLPSMTFAEGVVRSGDRVWVSGVLVRDHGGEHGYRDLAQRMRLVSGPGKPLTIGRARQPLRRNARTGR